MHLGHECVEPNQLVQLEMLTISVEVLEHLTVLDERLVSVFEWKVRERHHLLGKVSLEVFVHGGVDGEPSIVPAHIVSVDPGASDGVALLEYADCYLVTVGSQMSGSTETCSSSS